MKTSNLNSFSLIEHQTIFLPLAKCGSLRAMKLTLSNFTEICQLKIHVPSGSKLLHLRNTYRKNSSLVVEIQLLDSQGYKYIMLSYIFYFSIPPKLTMLTQKASSFLTNLIKLMVCPLWISVPATESVSSKFITLFN